MRLYTIIPNEIFAKALFDDAINANISISDFNEDSYVTDLLPYLERILYYKDKEELIDKAVCVFTSPRFCGVDISNVEVAISFEVDEKDVVLLDYNEFLNYTYNLDKVTSNLVFSKHTENTLREYFSNCEAKICDVKNFYEALAIVDNIPVHSIKSAMVTKNNPLVKYLQLNKQKIVNRIPLRYKDKGNNKVKSLLSYKPQQLDNNLKFLEGHSNVLWYCKKKVWRFKK